MTAVRWAAWAARIATATLVGVVLLGVVALPAAADVGDVTGIVEGRGTPQANATVTLVPVTKAGAPTGAASVTLTNASGRYAFDDVAAAYVKILVRAPAFSGYVDTFHPDTAAIGAAATLVTAPDGVVADVDLLKAGSVAGQVVDLQTRAPVEGARVTTWGADEPGLGELGIAAPTQEPGGFRVTGLPPVPLQVRVTLPAGSPYLDTPYEAGAATRGVVVDGARVTTDLVVGLRRGAQISGSVRDDAGSPVADATIQLTGCRPDCPSPAISDETGAYQIAGIRPGSGLGVEAWRGTDLLHQWFPGRADPAQAAKLTLTGAEVLDDVDFTLVRAAFLTVELRDDAGAPSMGAIVRLQTDGTTYHHYFAGPDHDSGEIGQSPSGAPRLRVGPVPPGSYTLRVTAASPTPGYLPRRWQTASGPAPMGTIRLAPGQEARTVTGLVAADTDRRPPQHRSVPAADGPWPGLTSGFLAPWDGSHPFPDSATFPAPAAATVDAGRADDTAGA